MHVLFWIGNSRILLIFVTTQKIWKSGGVN
nr:MAG TPA: hypothetical protein [Caudoviricetes sp.]